MDDDVVFVSATAPYKEQTIDNPLICKVCLDKRIDIVLYPCSHACICSSCYAKLSVPKYCPICRKICV